MIEGTSPGPRNPKKLGELQGISLQQEKKQQENLDVLLFYYLVYLGLNLFGLHYDVADLASNTGISFLKDCTRLFDHS